jgi:hypothetical protein
MDMLRMDKLQKAVDECSNNDYFKSFGTKVRIFDNLETNAKTHR